MLYYDKIDVSEGIDINEISLSKEFDICHFWYFLDKGFKFQPSVCNRCHNVLMMSINLNDITGLNIRGIDYHCIINGISKSDAMSILQNANLMQHLCIMLPKMSAYRRDLKKLSICIF